MLYKVLNKLKYLSVTFSLILILFTSIATSQENDSLNKKRNISFEGQLYPNFNSDEYRPQFKLRFNLNERFAIRVNTSFKRELTNNKILQISGDGVGYVEKIKSLHSLSLGFESQRRFKRSVFYSGLEGLVGYGKNNEYGSRTDSTSFVADYNYNIIRPIQQLGLRIFSGFDYFIYDKVYLGIEFGLVFLKTTNKKGSYQVLDSSSLTDSDVTTLIPENFKSSLNINGIGTLRIGWRF
jgi:hypothetical protein